MSLGNSPSMSELSSMSFSQMNSYVASTRGFENLRGNFRSLISSESSGRRRYLSGRNRSQSYTPSLLPPLSHEVLISQFGIDSERHYDNPYSFNNHDRVRADDLSYARSDTRSNRLQSQSNTSEPSYEELLALDNTITRRGISTKVHHNLKRRRAQRKEIGIACTICMEKFSSSTHLVVLPCGHKYHDQCVDQWLKSNRTCPDCRHILEE
mmetsp:Transcript_5353/g.5515  ORF Transcript_5353/g.5515 Transcript_5353/m.5515 type:complete len:210 (+) Transcript_5353:191-820(+)